jgi:hypothetical protein
VGAGIDDVAVSTLTATVVKSASGTLSAATGGTDYADNAFKTLSVSGQSDVVADSAADTLTFAAGSNITLTTNAGTDTITIAASGGGGGGGGTTTIGVANGRLTTETGVPVSTSDRTSQSTIYYSLYGGNQIGLYDGAAWTLQNFSELSLALSGLTSGKNYDVFVDYNSGTPQLVLSSAWSSDTARADAIALQDGIYVKSGTPAYRLVGTIRTTSTTTTEDSSVKRFVWNLYNRRPRLMARVETADTWAPGTAATYRQANANTANQFEVITGIAEDSLTININQGYFCSASTYPRVGIGVNSTTVNSAQTYVQMTSNNNQTVALSAQYVGIPRLGYSALAWLDYVDSVTGTQKFLGDTDTGGFGATANHVVSGMTGTFTN